VTELPGWLSEPADPVARAIALQAAVDARVKRQTASVARNLERAGFRFVRPGAVAWALAEEG
jgi:hypothetical protein